MQEVEDDANQRGNPLHGPDLWQKRQNDAAKILKFSNKDMTYPPTRTYPPTGTYAPTMDYDSAREKRKDVAKTLKISNEDMTYPPTLTYPPTSAY